MYFNTVLYFAFSLRLDSGKYENSNLKRHMYPSVHSSTTCNSQYMEATEMFTDRGMDREDMVRIYSGVSFSHKKEWNNAICSTLGGSRDYHTKWRKSEKDKYHDRAYTWNQTKWCKWTFLQNRNRLVDTENKFKVTKGEGEDRDKGIGWTDTLCEIG